MAEKGSISKIIIDNFRVGIIFAVLYLFLIVAAFMAALGNPTDSARIILEIFVIASPTENIMNNLVIWFTTGIIVSLILKKTRKLLTLVMRMRNVLAFSWSGILCFKLFRRNILSDFIR